MRRLYQLLLRFHAVLVFLFLQLIAFALLIRTNTFQYSTYFSTESKVISSILTKRNEVKNYFDYRQINEELAKQIAFEKNRSADSFVLTEGSKFFTKDDSLFQQKWDYSEAKLISKDVFRPNNTLTLQGGSRHGFKEDMGVISGNKLVGITTGVSQSFSIVLPIINQNFKTTIKHKKSGNFGQLEGWDGLDPQHSFVYGLPAATQVKVGDSIMTSGMSRILPENILVGTVAGIESNESADSYILKVKLATNFYNLEYVQVVDNLMKIEQIQLEEQLEENDP